jgi:hypothetical protein
MSFGAVVEHKGVLHIRGRAIPDDPDSFCINSRIKSIPAEIDRDVVYRQVSFLP